MMEHLLDTNIIIAYLHGLLPPSGVTFLNPIIDENPKISVITQMEILGFNFSSKEEESITGIFINASAVLDLNSDIISKTIQIRKQKKIKLPDAIIAATSMVNNLILITRNIDDFKGIEELTLINPFEI